MLALLSIATAFESEVFSWVGAPSSQLFSRIEPDTIRCNQWIGSGPYNTTFVPDDGSPATLWTTAFTSGRGPEAGDIWYRIDASPLAAGGLFITADASNEEYQRFSEVCGIESQYVSGRRATARVSSHHKLVREPAADLGTEPLLYSATGVFRASTPASNVLNASRIADDLPTGVCVRTIGDRTIKGTLSLHECEDGVTDYTSSSCSVTKLSSSSISGAAMIKLPSVSSKNVWVAMRGMVDADNADKDVGAVLVLGDKTAIAKVCM